MSEPALAHTFAPGFDHTCPLHKRHVWSNAEAIYEPALVHILLQDLIAHAACSNGMRDRRKVRTNVCSHIVSRFDGTCFLHKQAACKMKSRRKCVNQRWSIHCVRIWSYMLLTNCMREQILPQCNQRRCIHCVRFWSRMPLVQAACAIKSWFTVLASAGH